MLVDEILSQVGDFGLSQALIYCVLGLVYLTAGGCKHWCPGSGEHEHASGWLWFIAWQNLGITFFAGQMDHWCHVTALTNLSFEQQKHVAIPYDGNTDPDTNPGVDVGYSQCERFDLDYSMYSESELWAWNRSIMTSGAEVVPCDSWLYDRSDFLSTIVSQWDLVCSQRHLVSLVQTIYFTGFLIGCVVFGQISDRIGRKKTLLMSLLLWVGSGLTAAFVPHYIAFVVFRFVTGASVAGGFTTAFVIAMEVVGPHWRTSVGILVQVWFSAGIISAAGIAYMVRDHIYLQLILSGSITVLWAVAWFVPESPRWLVTMGRDGEAEVILRRFARINRTSLPDKLHLEDNHIQTGNAAQAATLLDLLKGPRLRFITLNMWFCWFASSISYYGLSLGVSLLGGSIFFNSFLSGLVEIPGILMAMVLLEKVGRRWPNVGCLVASGLACLICMIFVDNEDLQIVLTVFLMVGKLFSAGLFSIIYVYAAEIFPTVVRNVGVGSSSMVARVGSLLQPQVASLDAMWPQSQFLIYGVVALLGGATSYFFPETKGQKLPESLEEAENWKRRRAKSSPAVDCEAMTHF